MKFEVTMEQIAKIQKWLATEVYPPIIEKQLADPLIRDFIVQDQDGNSYPYLGAIGGGLTYEFTPTSLGTIFRVSFLPAVNGETKILDLTEYGDW